MISMGLIFPAGKYELSPSFSGEVHFGHPPFSIVARGFEKIKKKPEKINLNAIINLMPGGGGAPVKRFL